MFDEQGSAGVPAGRHGGVLPPLQKGMDNDPSLLEFEVCP
jgi:hypothetical protein